MRGRNTRGTSSRLRRDASDEARSRRSEVGATLQRTSQESKLCTSLPVLRFEVDEALDCWPTAVGQTAVAAVGVPTAAEDKHM